MLQRLPMKLAQVKAGKTSENLLKKKIDKLHVLCIYEEKLIKKLYKNIKNSIKI